jgi:2-dehydro-3-deoxyglucarate aldolase
MPATNAFRESLEAGAPVFGARAASYAPSLIEVYGDLGLDFVRVDLERPGPSPWDSRYLEDLVRTAAGADVELLVRLPDSDPTLVRRVVDTGVRNLLIPRVETAAEVRRAVQATQFSYDGGPGERSFSGWRATGYSTDVDPIDHDETICLGIMVETAAAVENAEEILSVPDLGFVFTGPNDLSVQYGVPGERTAPAVQDALDRVETLAREASVPLGAAGHDPETAIELLEDGYQVVRLLDEFDAIRTVYGERWATVSDHL